jgi:hypothetical protein
MKKRDVAYRISIQGEAVMAVAEPSWMIIIIALLGVVALGVALMVVLAVVLSGRNKSRRAPDRNEIGDLRDEVAELRAEFERMKADRPSPGRRTSSSATLANGGLSMTRKRRYLISAAVLVACVGVALGVMAMLPPSPVTRASIDRIEKGMTYAEVKAIFGEPFKVDADGGTWQHADGLVVFVWIADDRVFDTGFFQIHPTETIPDKLRRWLHLPK